MIKAKCALCGRPTVPYALIGNMAVGPKCAARAGLQKGKVPKGSSVRFVAQKHTAARSREPETLDLFADQESVSEQTILNGGA